MEHRVHVVLERRSGAGEAQDAPLAPQQGGAHLLGEPGQGPRDPGLGGPLQLAHLGDGGAVGDELEPAEDIRIHTYNLTAWIILQTGIGRMGYRDAAWSHEHP